MNRKKPDPLEVRLVSYGKETQKTLASEQSSSRMENLLTLYTLADKTRTPGHRLLDFTLAQVGSIGRWCVGWSLLWLLAFVLLLTQVNTGLPGEYTTLIGVSVLPGILVFLTAEDLARLLSGGMCELEKTTRYSLKQVVLMHFLMQGILQLLVVGVGILLISSRLQESIAKLLIYGYTPMIFSTALMLAGARRLRGEQIILFGRCICILVTFGILFAGQLCRSLLYAWNLFGENRYLFWKFGLILGLVFLLYELFCFGKELDSRETGIEWNIESL